MTDNKEVRLLTDYEALIALNEYPTHSGYVITLPHNRPLIDFIRIMEAQLAKDLKFEQQSVAEARKQERERILVQVVAMLGIIDYVGEVRVTKFCSWEDWLALKEEGKKDGQGIHTVNRRKH